MLPNPIHMTRIDRSLLKRMADIQAVIFDNGAKDILAIYARGDRRTKPAEWITRTCFLRLRASGDLIAGRTGFGVASGTAERVSNPIAERAQSEQHLGRETRDIYTPDAIVRSVRVSKTGGSLRRLSRRKHADGSPILSAAMIEAGNQFAHDYARAYGGGITTQNYSAPIVDGGHGLGDNATQRMAMQIDTSKRLAGAVAAMGTGLDRVVIAICCNDHDLSKLEHDEKWASRTGMVVLQLGLTRLVDYYGTVPGQL